MSLLPRGEKFRVFLLHIVAFVTTSTVIAATIRRRGEMKIYDETMELQVLSMKLCFLDKGEFALLVSSLKQLLIHTQRQQKN